MRVNTALVLSVATTLAFSANVIAAQSMANQQTSQPDAAAIHEASEMVSARTALKENIDADSSQPGAPVRVVLRKSVRLTNGIELPAGTAIVGEVTTDDMNLSGTAKLALRFTEAELKNGTVVPIKATIMGVYPPESSDNDGNPVAPGDQELHVWNHKSVGVEEVNAIDGVNLESQVASGDSGVLVAAKKHDVKLKWDSEIALAIAPRDNGQEKVSGT
jgi:hypothetical protein